MLIDSPEMASWKPPYNALINGCMSVAQRGTSFDATTTPLNSDDTYLLDRWILISDGNDIVDVSQQADGGVSGHDNYMRLDVETTAKKFGVLQVIEGTNCKGLIGETVSLSFEAKVTNASKLSDIRVVVVSWDSTLDTVTSDIISAWGAEGTNPTLVANWTEENTAANLGITTSWARYVIEGISIDTASAANIGVFIYSNNVATNDTAGIFLEITNVQLVEGSKAKTFQRRPYVEEIQLCRRYYERIVAGHLYGTFGIGIYNSSVSEVRGIVIVHSIKKRTASTLGYNGSFRANASGVSDTSVTLTTYESADWKHTITIGTATGFTNLYPVLLQSNNDATAYLEFIAEL